MANSQWWNLFPQANVTHGMATHSDNIPIWIDLEGEYPEAWGEVFRFEAMWLGEKGCDTIVEETWRNGNGSNKMEEVMAMISECGQKLELWNCTSFGNVQKELHKAKQKLKQIQDEDPLCVRREEQNEARDEVQKWLKRDEIMWRQRSKALWLKEGDHN